MEREAIRSTVGRRIREYREEQGIGLADLARRAGISRSYLYQIESGDSSPTAGVLRSIATKLGVTVSHLVDEDYTFPTPESLQEFADQDNIKPRDVKMLAQIKYRGRQPDTPEEWRLLWRVIKATIGEEE